MRRILPLFVVSSAITLFLCAAFQDASFPGLAEQSEEHHAQEKAAEVSVRRPFREPKIDSTSPYPIGATKPAGSNYTKCVVIARLRSEDTTWVESELGDMLDAGALTSAIYTVDDDSGGGGGSSGGLHVPANKGHEAMVYLSYIIDAYAALADVTVFMHAHRWAWHNNALLDTGDAAQMVRRLSAPRVAREGYMNLRCHWEPGCPAWLHPGAPLVRRPATTTAEQLDEGDILAAAWPQLFPHDPLPRVLAQPCCAQFAVSRDRIRAQPRDRYRALRAWLLATPLDDAQSGRVFEYIWQHLFTASPVHCPSMSACYCDGYGVCFGGPEPFDYWFELRYRANEFREELRLWHEKTLLIAQARADGLLHDEPDLLLPEPGRDRWLEAEIARLEHDMESRRLQALERGKDPKQRALEAGRKWKDGDGF